MPDEALKTPNTESFSDGTIPAEGTPKLGEFLYKKFIIAKKEKDRLNFHAKWMRNFELKRGRHFKTTNSKWPLVPVNIFYVAVARTKAHLTDSKPRFEIVAHDQDSQDQVSVIQGAAETWYRRTKQLKKHSDSIDNGETYGTTIEKMIFDPDLEGGLGDIDTVVVDPFKIFPWPGIREIQKMPFFFEIEILEIDEIRRRWPETGKDVKPDKQFSAEIAGEDRETIKAGTLANHRTQDNLPNNFAPSGGNPSKTGINRAMIIECWMKDYTMEDVIEERPILIPDQDPDSPTFGQTVPDPSGAVEEVVVGEQAKYPGFIRVAHIANDGKVTLDDLMNQSINPNLPREQTADTYLFDKYPYLKTESNADTTNFWAFSVIEQIEILGKELNKKISQIAAYIDKTIKPTLVMPKTAGIEAHEISNLPGQVFWPNNHIVSQFIRYMQIPPLPSDFYNYLELILRLVDIITGIQDVTEGRKPKGISAASAIIALQEKAQTVFREKIRNYDMALEEKGRMWISHFQNWYTENRKLKLSGQAAELAGGPFTEFRGTDIQGEYTFEVVSGSTLPKSLFVRLEQSVQLYNAGAIDQKAILEAFDFPKREEIIHRMQIGQLGILLEKLDIAGVPDEMLKVIEFVASLDDKEFKKQFQQPAKESGGQSQGEPKTQPGGQK